MIPSSRQSVRTLACAAAMLATGACKNGLSPASDAPSAPAAATANTAAAHPETTPTSSGTIEGRLEVAPEVAQNIKAGDTIFLIARDAQTNAMVAVTKLVAPPQFPLPFVLSGQNAMMGNTPFQGSVKLSARVDKDGDATSKNPGDVVGEIGTATVIPATGVVLTLNKLL